MLNDFVSFALIILMLNLSGKILGNAMIDLKPLDIVFLPIAGSSLFFILKGLMSMAPALPHLPEVVISKEFAIKSARDGDVFLFSCHEIGSAVVKFWSWSQFTHCAIACYYHGRMCLLHCDAAYARENLCPERGDRPGVQANDLSEYINTYDGWIYWIPTGLPGIRERLIEFFESTKCDVFEGRHDVLLRCTGFPLPKFERNDNTHFCSEWVFDALKSIDAVEAHDPTLLHPSCFAEGRVRFRRPPVGIALLEPA